MNTCHIWLLDSVLGIMLDPERGSFCVVQKIESRHLATLRGREKGTWEESDRQATKWKCHKAGRGARYICIGSSGQDEAVSRVSLVSYCCCKIQRPFSAVSIGVRTSLPGYGSGKLKSEQFPELRSSYLLGLGLKMWRRWAVCWFVMQLC